MKCHLRWYTLAKDSHPIHFHQEDSVMVIASKAGLVVLSQPSLNWHVLPLLLALMARWTSEEIFSWLLLVHTNQWQDKHKVLPLSTYLEYCDITGDIFFLHFLDKVTNIKKGINSQCLSILLCALSTVGFGINFWVIQYNRTNFRCPDYNFSVIAENWLSFKCQKGCAVIYS